LCGKGAGTSSDGDLEYLKGLELLGVLRSKKLEAVVFWFLDNVLKKLDEVTWSSKE